MVFTTYQQFRSHYFPQEVEAERRALLTPEQRAVEDGQALAKVMLKSVRRALARLPSPA